MKFIFYESFKTYAVNMHNKGYDTLIEFHKIFLFIDIKKTDFAI